MSCLRGLVTACEQDIDGHSLRDVSTLISGPVWMRISGTPSPTGSNISEISECRAVQREQ